MNRQQNIFYGSFLGFLLFLVMYTVIIAANPIPIPPHPQQNFPSYHNEQGLPIAWIIIIFIVDFFLDTLLLYAGVLFLERFTHLSSHQVFDMPKTKFFSAVLIISLVGLSSEWILGSTVLGLFLTLCCVFLSFCLVCHYMFRFTWRNASYLGGFASLINLLIWIVLFIV